MWKYKEIRIIVKRFEPFIVKISKKIAYFRETATSGEGQGTSVK